MKLSLQKDPNHIILHVGTNDVILDRTSQDIATSIVNLVYSMKDENCDVSISKIILRTDNKKFSQKSWEVNTHLKDMCKEMNIYLIDNTNKIKAKHLNKGRGVLMYLIVLLLANYLGFWLDNVIKIIKALLLGNLTLIKQMLTKKLQMATGC